MFFPIQEFKNLTSNHMLNKLNYMSTISLNVDNFLHLFHKIKHRKKRRLSSESN